MAPRYTGCNYSFERGQVYRNPLAVPQIKSGNQAAGKAGAGHGTNVIYLYKSEFFRWNGVLRIKTVRKAIGARGIAVASKTCRTQRTSIREQAVPVQARRSKPKMLGCKRSLTIRRKRY